jgi:tetrahydromethanopterin:alpha-L-glutamate ligase
VTLPWIAVVSSGASGHTDALLAAGRGRARMEVVDAGDLSVDLHRSRLRLRRCGAAMPPFDAALFRRINPRVSFDFQMQALREWERNLAVAMNPVGPMLLAMDKFAVGARLKERAIPIPATWVVPDLRTAEDLVRREGLVVAKPLYGSMGEGVQLWRHQPGIRNVIADFLAEYGVVLLQEFVPCDGRDVRVFVIGGRAVAGCTRMAVEGEWRTNVAQGGVPDAIEVTPEMERLAVDSVRAVGLTYSGVDLIQSPAGWKVLEVNGSPSFQGLERATGLNVAKLMVTHLLESIEAVRQKSHAA